MCRCIACQTILIAETVTVLRLIFVGGCVWEEGGASISRLVSFCHVRYNILHFIISVNETTVLHSHTKRQTLNLSWPSANVLITSLLALANEENLTLSNTDCCSTKFHTRTVLFLVLQLSSGVRWGWNEKKDFKLSVPPVLGWVDVVFTPTLSLNV